MGTGSASGYGAPGSGGKSTLEYANLLPKEHIEEAVRLLRLLDQRDSANRNYMKFLRDLPQDVKKSITDELFSNGLIHVAAPRDESDYLISPNGTSALHAYDMTRKIRADE